MPAVNTSDLTARVFCRHDLKIYSSDEGRVQMTAAAFVKGFLDLEGELTPILASLVRTVYSTQLLDDADPASDVMARIKKRLMKALTTAIDPRQVAPTSNAVHSESDAGGSVSSGRKRGMRAHIDAPSRRQLFSCFYGMCVLQVLPWRVRPQIVA